MGATEVSVEALAQGSGRRSRTTSRERGITVRVGPTDNAVIYAERLLLTRRPTTWFRNAVQYNRPGGGGSSRRKRGRTWRANGPQRTRPCVSPTPVTAFQMRIARKVFERFYRGRTLAKPSRAALVGIGYRGEVVVSLAKPFASRHRQPTAPRSKCGCRADTPRWQALRRSWFWASNADLHRSDARSAGGRSRVAGASLASALSGSIARAHTFLSLATNASGSSVAATPWHKPIVPRPLTTAAVRTSSAARCRRNVPRRVRHPDRRRWCSTAAQSGFTSGVIDPQRRAQHQARTVQSLLHAGFRQSGHRSNLAGGTDLPSPATRRRRDSRRQRQAPS